MKSSFTKDDKKKKDWRFYIMFFYRTSMSKDKALSIKKFAMIKDSYLCQELHPLVSTPVVVPQSVVLQPIVPADPLLDAPVVCTHTVVPPTQ
jgi:hypothetical protein